MWDGQYRLSTPGKLTRTTTWGSKFIQSIVELASRPEFRRKIVFLENYDMATARCMVQGCDVWLNTPLRPLEASGTSGMKAQANGVLSLSTLDGWWDEAWEIGKQSQTEVGWAIGSGEAYADQNHQDQVEADALYELLEREIVPAFYERRADGLPRRWISRMKSSITKLCPEFNMHRMVKQYANEYYLVAHNRYERLRVGDAQRAVQLASWLSKVENAWPAVMLEPGPDGIAEIAVGEQLEVTAQVFLDTLTPEDVAVEIVQGRVNSEGDIQAFSVTPMQRREEVGPGEYRFQAKIQPVAQSGLYGYAIRVLPKHPDALTPFMPGLILWARGRAAAAAQG
jgi:starch phosphorylase